MKKLVLLVFLLSVSFAYSQHLVKPDTLWTYGPAKFTSYPAVHPNGNVLVRVNSDLIELNGTTGLMIRSIYIPSNDYNDRIQISSDGSRIIAGDYWINYETGELIEQFTYIYKACFLNPHNNIVVYIKPAGLIPTDTNLIIKNLSDGAYQVINTQDFPTAIAVSNDGRYLALACLDEPEEHTHFYLYDAQTMKDIREFENVPSTGRRIEFIQFSENAKYVGYGHVSGGSPKATYFSCPDPIIKKEFNSGSLGFISDKYAWIVDDGSYLWDIGNNNIIYQTKDYVSYYPVYNKIKNSILVFASEVPTLVALDLDAILSGVDVRDNSYTDSLTIIYMNGFLQISDIEPTSATIDIKLFDLNGKLIYRSVQSIIEDNLQIRIDLLSGVYILQLQSGNKQYSQKFIISN